MAKMNSKHRYMYDSASKTLLRPREAEPLTASGIAGIVPLDTLEGFWNAEGELADDTLAIVVNVTDVKTSDGDEFYVLDCAPLDDGGQGFNNISFGYMTITKPGQYVILVDIPTLEALTDPTSYHIYAQIAGTNPSITFHAWVAAIRKA